MQQVNGYIVTVYHIAIDASHRRYNDELGSRGSLFAAKEASANVS